MIMSRYQFLLSSMIVLFLLSWRRCIHSFHLPSVGKQYHYSYSRSTNLQLNSAATALIKKGKKKELASLLQEIENSKGEHYITKFLNDKSYLPGVGESPNNFHDFTFSKKGTLKILPEYNHKAKTGFVMGIPLPEVLGGIFRDCAQGVIVSMDKRSGGSTVEEFTRFTKEQYRFRRSNPVSVPVVWNDYVVDELQVQQAAALGAAAVVLSADMGDLPALLSASQRYNMGAIVLAQSTDEALAAAAAGARSICLYNMEESVFVATRQQLDLPDNIQIGAKLRPEGDFSTFSEIDTTWVLRDAGFNFMWPSCEAVFSNNVNDVYSTLLAMRAKCSRHFDSPRQFFMERLREGSQEYLGDILY